MPNIPAIIIEFLNMGLKISLDETNSNLKISGDKKQLTKELLSKLKEHKDEIVVLLKEQKESKRKQFGIEIEKCEESDSYPLSSSQRRLWILSQFDEASLAYNIPTTLTLSGETRWDLLNRAIELLIEKHEILRTVFRENEEGEIRQWVLGKRELKIEIGQVDLRLEENPVEIFRAKVNEDCLLPFNLSEGPLLRGAIFQLSDDEFQLYLNMHHIIGDGWSVEVLKNDLFRFYALLEKDINAQPNELAIQYKDYSIWQNNREKSEEFENERNYWLNQFSDEIPLIDLPRSKVRPKVKSYTGRNVQMYLSKEDTNQLKSLAKANEASLFMVVLASLKALLKRYSGENDIILGTPSAGRDHADLKEQIGFYVNMLPLRTEVSDDDNFITLLLKVRDTAFKGYENQLFPFDALVEDLQLVRDPSRNPIFDLSITYHNFSSERVDLKDIDISKIAISESQSVRYDVEFHIVEKGDYLSISATYNESLYEESMIRQLLIHYKQLLGGLLSSPEAKLSEVEMLSEAERKMLLNDFNSTTSIYPSSVSIPSLFADQVKERGDLSALVYEGTVLTYNELDALSNRLAHALLETHELKKGDFVGIMLDRSEWVIVSILGILKAGGVYVPMDPEYPSSRKEYIIEDTGLDILVTTTSYMFDIDYFEGSIVAIDVELDDDSLSEEAVDMSISPTDLAYVIYTSGSTGQPKGVMVEHRSVIRLVKNTNFTGTDGTERILGLSNYAFDGSTFDIYMPLLNGGTAVVSHKDIYLDLGKFNQLLESESIDGFFLTTVLFNTLVDAELEELGRLKYLLFGGEQVSVDHVRRFKARYPSVSLHHVYGPTENTTYSSWYKVEEVAEGALTVPIGSGISNSTCYLLGPSNELVPVGVPGEICVGGDGLARGYLNNEELTQEKFIAHPFQEGERLYKSGDLGRWTKDGAIEFIGRKDNQVKVRGHRIELGEIEHRLCELSSIDTGLVLVRENDHKEKSIVAYFTSSSSPTVSDLRTGLKAHLPDYMLPHYFVQVDEMPLTSNGKVDKRSLPDPEGSDLSRGVEYVAPTTEREESLLKVWQDYFGDNGLGIKHDYFEIGGDSIKAIQLVVQLNKLVGKDYYSISDLYSNSTVEALAKVVKEESEVGNFSSSRNDIEKEFKELENKIIQEARDKKIDTSNWERVFPMSGIQKGLVFESSLGNGAYLECQTKQFLDDQFNILIFRKALNDLVEKHAILRTKFFLHEFEEMLQVVVKELESEEIFKSFDLREKSQDEQRVFLESYRNERMHEGFDKEGSLQWEMALARLSNDSFLFVFVFHHAIFDGWSFNSMMAEMTQRYFALKKDEALAKMTPLKSDYRDYVIEQKILLKSKEVQDYWISELSNFKKSELPFHKKCNRVNDVSSVELFLSDHLKLKVSQYLDNNGITKKAFFLSVLSHLIGLTTGERQITIGLSANSRPTLEDGDKILACFTNGIPFRVSLTDSLLDLPKRIEEKLRNLKKFEGLAYYDIRNILRENDDYHGDYYDVMYNYTDFHVVNNVSEEYQGQHAIIAGAEKTNSPFLVQLVHVNGDYRIGVNLEKSLYNEFEIRSIKSYFQSIVEILVGERLEKDGFLSQEEKDQLSSFNATHAVYPKDKTVIDLFEEQVAITPNATAVVFEDKQLSYSELDALSNQLANYLIANYGIGTEDLVGIKLDRSEWLIISILATLKSGGAYVPIDPSYPADRIAYIEQDTQSMVCIDTEELEAFMSSKTDYASSRPQRTLSPNNLAYIIYTSGSTGQPKGVMVEHRSIVRLVKNNRFYSFGSSDVLLSTGSISFDATTMEYWGMLLNGGRLILSDQEALLDTLQLSQLIESHGVNVMWFTSGLLNQLVDEDLGLFKGLSTVIAGGDKLSPEHISKLKEAYERMRVINGYGPTENTTFSLTYPIEEVSGSIPIGSPISNSSCYVLNATHELQPIGVIGEICLGGDGLARGYLNNDELTQEKFIAHPFKEGERLYKTGDLGRWLSDGNIEFIGRKDDQVKIRGYRIELGEIEHALSQIEGITSSVVVVKESDSHKELVAYLTSDQEQDASTIRASLREFLPDYMLPGYYVQLESLPLTSNGKVDKKRLPNPEGLGMSSGVEYVAPSTDIEMKLVKLWEEVLGKNAIGVNNDFFELGGNSLKAGMVLSALRSILPFNFRMQQLYEHTTIRELAQHIEMMLLLDKAVDSGEEDDDTLLII